MCPCLKNKIKISKINEKQKKKKVNRRQRAEEEPLTSAQKVYNGLILIANLMRSKLP